MADTCDSIQHYNNLIREQHNLQRSIRIKSRNVEELLKHIASLKQSLEEYRRQRTWLSTDQHGNLSNEFDPSLEVQKMLEKTDISDVVQNLELEKTILNEKGAKLLMELQKEC